MLVPRRVSKKRPDSAVAAKRRKIEDKERPFRLSKEAPSPPQVVPISEKKESDPESLIWANLVYLHLWSWILHEDTLTLTCRPKSQYVSCHSILQTSKAKPDSIVKVVQSVSKHARDQIDTRIALDQTDTGTSGSGYEVRLQPSEIARNKNTSSGHAAYLESIPQAHQSIMGITKLVTHNLPAGPTIRLGGVIALGETHKGERTYEQVMLVFLEQADRDAFLTAVPWHDQTASQSIPAFCSCIRACSLERFASLKSEYLALQASLAPIEKDEPAVPISLPQAQIPVVPISVRVNRPLGYPPGRLVFLRNVPTTTNKTAIKAEIGLMLGDSSGVDYADWTKGNDTAHVRLSKAIDSEQLSGLLERNPLKDNVQVELLGGERESIYWSRLPDKIRQAALDT